MKDLNQGIQEEINITTNTQYLNEKALKESDDYSVMAFYGLSVMFGSSLFMQLILLIPNSFNIAFQIPIILSVIFLIVNIAVYFIKKTFKWRVYFFVAAIIVGMIIGL